MNLESHIEIHNPELLERLNVQLQSRYCDDVDELIEKALDALDEKSPLPLTVPSGSLHEFFMNSPLRGANLDLERMRDYPRAVDL